MPQSIVFPEWLNSNSLRSYPIRENADRTDSSGNFIIPNDLIVAAQINCPRSMSGGTFFVSKLVVGATFVSVYFGYSSGGSSSDVAYIKAEKSSFSRFSYYSFVGQGDYSGVLGYVAVGDIASTIRAGVGQFAFSPESAPLEVNTYFVSVPAVEAIEILSSGGSLVHRSTEVLKLRAGENIRLEYVDGGSYDTIKISAISGENLVKPQDCANVQEILPPCIRQINGVPPDPDGKFWIDESECIEIEEDAGGNSIKIIDKCSQSCCGCEQLQVLTDALEALRLQEQALKDLVNSTQSQQSEMLANLIANL